jgi:hypothetical protein
MFLSLLLASAGSARLDVVHSCNLGTLLSLKQIFSCLATADFSSAVHGRRFSFKPTRHTKDTIICKLIHALSKI